MAPSRPSDSYRPTYGQRQQSHVARRSGTPVSRTPSPFANTNNSGAGRRPELFPGYPGTANTRESPQSPPAHRSPGLRDIRVTSNPRLPSANTSIDNINSHLATSNTSISRSTNRTEQPRRTTPTQGAKRKTESPSPEDIDRNIPDFEASNAQSIPRERPRRTPVSKRRRVHAVRPFDISHLVIEGDRVKPYEPYTEDKMPQLAYFHPSFRLAEDGVARAVHVFFQAMEEAKFLGYKNSSIEQIYKDNLQQYINVEQLYPTFGSIAVLGSAGSGKSSTINSIVGVPNLMLANGGVNRGTNLVHSLSCPLPSQSSKYAIAAPYMDDERIDAAVRKNYHDVVAHLHVGQTDEEVDDGERDESRAAYESAMEFFRTLLCDYLDLSTHEAVYDFFQSSENEEEIVQKLKQYVAEFISTRPIKYDDRIEHYDAEDVMELHGHYRRVSRVPLNPGSQTLRGNPWPLLSKVDIRFDNPLLRQFASLNDTPGTSDTNKAVVNATKACIDQASFVFIVESRTRITTGGTFDQHLRECIRRHKTRSVAVILTEIDNEQITPKENRTDMANEDRKRLEDAEAVAEYTEMQLDSLKSRSEALISGDSFSEETRKELQELRPQIRHMEISAEHARARVNTVNIDIHAGQAERSLKDRLRIVEGSANAPDLRVFPISNTLYKEHLAGFLATKPPMLELNACSIPRLLRFMFALPARGKVATLRNACRNILPRNFNSIIGILTKSPLQRKQEVAELISDALSGYHRLAEDISFDIQRSFEQHAVEAINTGKARWDSKAYDLIREWAVTFRGRTFIAFARRSGCFKPKGSKDDICWNDQMSNLMKSKLNKAFDAFQTDLFAMEQFCISQIGDLFQGLLNALEGCDCFQIKGTAAFHDSIRSTRDHLQEDMADIFVALSEHAANLRHRLTLDQTEDESSTMVAEVMQPAYDACKTIADEKPAKWKGKKPGKRDTMVNRLQRHVMGIQDDPETTSRTLFTSVVRMVESEFQSLLKDWNSTHLLSKLEEACDQIKNDFDSRFSFADKTGTATDGDERAIEVMTEGAHAAMDIINGELRAYWDELDAYETEEDS